MRIIIAPAKQMKEDTDTLPARSFPYSSTKPNS